MYNTPSEIHIAIDQALQYNNTNRKAILLPEQKDWLFNETMITVIDGIISKHYDGRGYDDDVLTYDALKPLKNNIRLQPYNVVDDKVLFRLPSDYKDKSAMSIVVTASCSINTPVDVISRYSVLKLGNSLAPYYGDLKIDITTPNGIINIFDLSTIGYTVSNIQLKFVLIGLILEAAHNNKNVDIYWERYNDLYHPDSFIIFYEGEYTSMVMTYNSTILTSVYTSTSSQLNTYNTSRFSKPITLVSSEHIFDIKYSHISKPTINNILATLDKNVLTVHTNNNFGVVLVELEYIKKPILLNFSANRMIELANISDAIVQRTVQAIKARTKDENYNEISKENIMNKVI